MSESDSLTDREKLEEALMKKALGFTTEEITEEFAGEDGLKICKRKVNKKVVPPDLASLQILLGRLDQQNQYSSFTDEELYSEREKLLQLLEKGGQDEVRRDDNQPKV